MQKPIRIAQIIGKMNAGGVESVIYNYYKNLDHSKFQFDFYVDADSNCEFPQELINMGARCYVIPPYQKLPQYMSALVKKFRDNRYQIVHINLNTLSVFALCAAWIVKVPVRINHNHSTAGKGEIKKNVLKYALRPFAKIFATHYCACSVYAGEWLFGKKAMKKGKVQVFHNAIDVGKFAFNPDVRQEVRKELHIEDKTVIGHVGRFCYQKNHEFLIDIFNQVYQRDDNAVLVLVGIGELTDIIKNKVHRLGLDGKVMFLGERKDVHRIYQGMDVFVLPSHYEGLGVVAIEAQAAGLPVFVSEQVPREVIISDNIYFLHQGDPGEWEECILLHQSARNNLLYENIRKKGYDIKAETKKLERYYCEALKENSSSDALAVSK